MIYNGPPKDVIQHFSQFGMNIDKFSNPADKLIQVANKPKSLMNEQFNFYDMAAAC